MRLFKASSILNPQKWGINKWRLFINATNIHPQISDFIKCSLCNEHFLQINVWKFICNFFYIDCRRKLHLIKSERFESLYWKHWWKISICLYLSFWGLRKLSEIKCFNAIYTTSSNTCSIISNIKSTVVFLSFGVWLLMGYLIDWLIDLLIHPQTAVQYFSHWPAAIWRHFLYRNANTICMK